MDGVQPVPLPSRTRSALGLPSRRCRCWHRPSPFRQVPGTRFLAWPATPTETGACDVGTLGRAGFLQHHARGGGGAVSVPPTCGRSPGPARSPEGQLLLTAEGGEVGLPAASAHALGGVAPPLLGDGPPGPLWPPSGAGSLLTAGWVQAPMGSLDLPLPADSRVPVGDSADISQQSSSVPHHSVGDRTKAPGTPLCCPEGGGVGGAGAWTGCCPVSTHSPVGVSVRWVVWGEEGHLSPPPSQKGPSPGP